VIGLLGAGSKVDSKRYYDGFSFECNNTAT
jgi:hypothetical protein